MSAPKATSLAVKLVVLCLLLLAGSIVVVVLGSPAGEFPWGIHLVTIPGVLLVGVVVGWTMRDRQAAEERARAELSEHKP